MAVPFDPLRLEVMGAAVPVVEGVLQSRNTGAANTAFLTMDHWFMLREVFRRTDVGWCGSVVTEQSNRGRSGARLYVPAAFARRSTGSRGDRRTGGAGLAA